MLLRELLAGTGGHELIAALALGAWILLSGLGVLLGEWLAGPVDSRRAILPLGHLILAILPFPALACARLWPTLAALPGAQPGLAASLLGILATFLPCGLLSGAMVPWLGRRIPERSAVGTAYAMDGFGSAIGGAGLGLMLLAGLPHVWCLAAAGLPHLLAATGRRPLPLTIGLGILAVSAATIDRPTLAARFPGQRIVAQCSSPFGQTVITRLGSQGTVYREGTPVYSTGDRRAESRIHPALCQVPEGGTVLLVGGSLFGAATEACRHHPARVDCVESDDAIYTLARSAEATELDLDVPAALGAPIRTFTGDGRAFLRGAPSSYDAIVLDLPPPETVGWNRYYTREFFREARAALRSGGVLSFTLPSSPNYLGPEQLALERSIAAALRDAFTAIEVLPGESHIFLARNGPIDLEIAPTLEARGIVTTRLLDYDWPELNDPFRRDELAARLGLARAAANGASPARPNEDLSPRAFRHLLEQRVRIDGGWRWLMPVAGLFLILFLLSTRGRAPLFAVASSGAAVMAIEVATLLLFQVLSGQLYLWLAAFVTIFLTGAAVGALLAIRRSGTGLRTPSSLARADAALLLGTLLFLAVTLTQARLSSAAGRTLIAHGALPLLAFLTAIPAGWQFVAAARGAGRPALARLYWADLAGAAFGTIAAGLLLLPTAGAIGVLAAAAALKGVSLLRLRGRGGSGA